MNCPTFETLIDYADGLLAAPERPAIEAHLAADCGDCRATLAWYAGFADAAREDATVEPPSWVTNRALEAFADAREAASRRGVRGLVARIRAALVFDSFANGLAHDALPARSAAAPTRQLLYSAVPFDVDLYLASGDTPRVLAVSGQVLPIDGDDFASVRGMKVSVERDGATVASVETSEFGEFTIDGVPPGIYDLRLGGVDREIMIWRTPLSLG